MKKVFLVALLAAASLAAQNLTKVIQVKYRSAEALVQLLPPGPHRSSREFNTISLTGSEEQLKSLEAIIRQYDTPPRQVEFQLRIIEASSAAQGPNDAADVVPAELKSLLRYTRYAQLGFAVLRGVEGDRMSIELAGGMRGRTDFRLVEGQPPSLDVRLTLEGPAGLIKTKDGEVTNRPTMLETRATVKSGETVVLGASNVHGGPNAMIALLTTKLLP